MTQPNSPKPPRPAIDADPAHPRNPLQGVTLEAIITQMVEWYGFPELGRQIPVRCFLHDPSIKSSLTFLRKTPWAREKVERWFVAERRRRKAREKKQVGDSLK